LKKEGSPLQLTHENDPKEAEQMQTKLPVMRASCGLLVACVVSTIAAGCDGAKSSVGSAAPAPNRTLVTDTPDLVQIGNTVIQTKFKIKIKQKDVDGVPADNVVEVKDEIGNEVPEDTQFDPNNPPAGALVKTIKVWTYNPTTVCVYLSNGSKRCYTKQ
jgi:hypothetical protein